MTKCVRMITGEDVICELENTTTGFRLIKPVQMMLGPTPDGNTGVRMAPFPLFGKNEDIEVPSSSVSFEYEPNAEIRNLYSTRFGSGIVVPQIDSKKLLLET